MRRKPGAIIPRWDGRPFHIFSADPGATTGCATASWKPTSPSDQLTSVEQIKFTQFQIGPDAHHLQLWSILNGNSFTEIVWESFEFRQHVYTDEEGNPVVGRSKVELISKEYIGVLELFCALTSTKSHHRTASSAKRFINDEKIKQLGLWLPGMPHAMDATSHLLRYMVVVKKIQEPFTDIWLAD
jgi:hypothetical protein